MPKYLALFWGPGSPVRHEVHICEPYAPDVCSPNHNYRHEAVLALYKRHYPLVYHEEPIHVVERPVVYRPQLPWNVDRLNNSPIYRRMNVVGILWREVEVPQLARLKPPREVGVSEKLFHGKASPLHLGNFTSGRKRHTCPKPAINRTHWTVCYRPHFGLQIPCKKLSD